MPNVTKKQWVDALKSGKYQKGKKALSQNGAYCCLGVLAEELCIPKRMRQDQKDEYDFKELPDGSLRRYSFLPDNLIDIACQTALTELNDENDDWDGVIEFLDETFGDNYVFEWNMVRGLI